MQRRTLLQLMISAAAVLPFERLRLLAQPRELTPEAVATLREIAPTVLPSSLGAARIAAIVDKFIAWTRDYRESVPLMHGYGHPRLQKTPATPAPRYVSQLAAMDAEVRARGARWSAIDLESRRTILDAALTRAGVRNLPQRPAGEHVVADLMAFYFRSTEANDHCYSAAIQRGICRPIAVTTSKPGPLGGQRGEEGAEPAGPAPAEAGAYAALTIVSEDHHAGS